MRKKKRFSEVAAVFLPLLRAICESGIEIDPVERDQADMPTVWSLLERIDEILFLYESDPEMFRVDSECWETLSAAGLYLFRLFSSNSMTHTTLAQIPEHQCRECLHRDAVRILFEEALFNVLSVIKRSGRMTPEILRCRKATHKLLKLLCRKDPTSIDTGNITSNVSTVQSYLEARRHDYTFANSFDCMVPFDDQIASTQADELMDDSDCDCCGADDDDFEAEDDDKYNLFDGRLSEIEGRDDELEDDLDDELLDEDDEPFNAIESLMHDVVCLSHQFLHALGRAPQS